MPIGPMSALTIGTCNSVKQPQNHTSQPGHVPNYQCNHQQKSLPGHTQGISCFPNKARISEMMGLSANSASATSRRNSNNPNNGQQNSRSLSKVMKRAKQSEKMGSKKRLMASFASRSSGGFSGSSLFSSVKSASRKHGIGLSIGTSNKSDQHTINSHHIKPEDVESEMVPKLHSLQSLDFTDESGFSNIIGQLSRNSGKRSFKISIKSRLSSKGRTSRHGSRRGDRLSSGISSNRSSRKSLTKLPFNNFVKQPGSTNSCTQVERPVKLPIGMIPFGFDLSSCTPQNQQSQIQINSVNDLKLKQGSNLNLHTVVSSSQCDCSSGSEAFNTPKLVSRGSRNSLKSSKIFKQTLGQRDSGISNDSCNLHNFTPICKVVSSKSELKSQESQDLSKDFCYLPTITKKVSSPEIPPIAINHASISNLPANQAPTVTNIVASYPEQPKRPTKVFYNRNGNIINSKRLSSNTKNPNTVGVNGMTVPVGLNVNINQHPIAIGLQPPPNTIYINQEDNRTNSSSSNFQDKLIPVIAKTKLENRISKDSVITNSTVQTSDTFCDSSNFDVHSRKSSRNSNLQMGSPRANPNYPNHYYENIRKNYNTASSTENGDNINYINTLQKKKMASQKITPSPMVAQVQKIQLKPMTSLPPLGTPMSAQKEY